MVFSAHYYDGQSSRQHSVEVVYHDGMLAISGDVRRTCAWREVRVAERVHGNACKLLLPDGAYLEIIDGAVFSVLLKDLGYRDPVAIRMHRSWRNALMAMLLLVAVLVPTYFYGLPAASKAVAKRLPERIQLAIGREALGFLDSRMFAPSELPRERREALIQRFQALSLPQQGTPTHEILFRKSRIGPNAFALPSGQIVMTDELVKLLDNDDAVVGVLAHEMGHLHERHLLRRIIQGSVVGLVTMVLFGDVSSIVSAIPTTMLDLKYSRDAEREADDYAIAMMKLNGIGMDGLKLTFEKLGQKSKQMNAYLSSHPPAAERLDRIRQAE